MGIEDRDYMSRDLDGKYLEPVVTQQVIAEKATSQPRRRPAKATRPRKSKLFIAVLCMFSLAIAIGCFGQEQATSGPSLSKWDYEVFSFNLEATHRNYDGNPVRFSTGTSQFDGTIQHIEENGWEYVGVIHAAGELQNHFTYVLFRRPR